MTDRDPCEPQSLADFINEGGNVTELVPFDPNRKRFEGIRYTENESDGN